MGIQKFIHIKTLCDEGSVSLCACMEFLLEFSSQTDVTKCSIFAYIIVQLRIFSTPLESERTFFTFASICAWER